MQFLQRSKTTKLTTNFHQEDKLTFPKTKKTTIFQNAVKTVFRPQETTPKTVLKNPKKKKAFTICLEILEIILLKIKTKIMIYQGQVGKVS